MKYIVVEIQSNSDGTIGNIVSTFDNEQAAAAHYHQILASAAVSSVYKHSAFILSDDGFTLKSEGYRHEVEVE